MDAEEAVDENAGDAVVDAILNTTLETDQVVKDVQRNDKKRNKLDEGGGTHFKENPYTFIAPDDPIVQSCMYVFPH